MVCNSCVETLTLGLLGNSGRDTAFVFWRKKHGIIRTGLNGILYNHTFASAHIGQKNKNTMSDLPEGWEERTDQSGRKYYIDHNNKKTQWERPAPPMNKFQSPPAMPNPFRRSITISDKMATVSSPTLRPGQLGDLRSTSVDSFDTKGSPRGSFSADIVQTNYFGNNFELQQMANEVLPARIITNVRSSCFRCSAKFIPSIQTCVHCRSCGEVFCKRCCHNKAKLLLPDPEYNQPVRVCDYCLGHIMTGDHNSLLRYLFILAEPEVPDALKLQAAKVLYLSICHEKLWTPEEDAAKGGNYDVALKYPALYEAIHRLGGFDGLWSCIIPNLDVRKHVLLRNQICRIISKVLLRTAGDECFRTYYNYNVIELLLGGIDEIDLAEAAADALVCGFLRDTTNHLLHFEGNIANIEHIVDVCMRAPHSVQTHLLNFFVFAFRSSTTRELVRIALEMGIVGLLSTTLKADGSPVQEVSVYCLHSLLLKVTKTKEFKLMLVPLITEVVQFGIVEQLAKVIIASEYCLEHPICASAVEIYSIVSFEKISHASLVAHVHVLSTRTKKVVSNLASTALQKMLDFMVEVDRNRLQNARELHKAMTHIFMVIHNMLALSPDMGIKVMCTRIVAPSLTMLCYAEGLARSGCAEFVYLYKDSEELDNCLVQFEDYDDLFRSLIHSIDKDNAPNIVNYSMDLLAILMQKLLKLKFPILKSDGTQRNSLRNMFIMIMEFECLWRRMVEYLDHSEKALFSMKLINVFASFKDLFVLHYLQEKITHYKLIDSIVDVIVGIGSSMNSGGRKQFSAGIREAAYIALGSLIGCPPINPSEHDFLNRLGGNYFSKSAEPLRLAQRRANLDEGSSLRELKLQCHSPALLSYEINTGMTMDALVQKVWRVEMQWRGYCVQKADLILRPAIATKSTVILPIAMAALRIIQIILRDGASEEDSFHKNIEYYSFVAYLNQIDHVYLILALDVFGVMSAFSDISVDNGIEFVCTLLTSADPMIKYKALETLVFCSLNTNTLECIGLNALNALPTLLKLSTHISNVVIDSHFMLHGVLVVISRLLADNSSASFVVKSSILPMIIEILKLDENETQLLNYEAAQGQGRACVQEIDPQFHRRTPTVDMATVTIHKLAFVCICRFAKHEPCRMSLLNADVAPILMSRVATELAVLQSSNQLPPLLRLQSVTLQQELSEDAKLSLTALFHLCSRHIHPLLTSEVLQEYFAVDALVYLWASQHRSFSYMAKIILARCSLAKDSKPAAGTGSIVTVTVQMQPWKRLIEMKQVTLLFDLLIHGNTDSANNGSNVIYFDDATDMQLKSSVCEAINAILLDARHSSALRGIAMKVDGNGLTTGNLSNNSSSNNIVQLSGRSSGNASPRVGEGSSSVAGNAGSESSVDIIFRAINKVCSMDIVRSLESLRLLSTHVATFLLDFQAQQGHNYVSSHSVMMPVRTLSTSRSPTPSLLNVLDNSGFLPTNGNISGNSSVASGNYGGGETQSVSGNSGVISAITMSVAPNQPVNARDRRQVFKSLLTTIRHTHKNGENIKKDDLGMSVTHLVETVSEIVQEVHHRLHTGTKLNENEALEAVNSANDCLLVVITLYEIKCITLAYQSESHLCIITADHIIIDMRPIFDILLQLCRKKSSAPVFFSAPYVFPSLVKTLQTCFDALPIILDHPNVKGNEKRLPELISIWQSFSVLLTLSKLGEAVLAERLWATSPGSVKLFVHVFTMELTPAMSDVCHLCPWSHEIFNVKTSSSHSSQSTVPSQNTREMSLFDRMLSIISVLSCGKSPVIEALLGDSGRVLTHLSELIQADLFTTFSPPSSYSNPIVATSSPVTGASQRKSLSRTSSPRAGFNGSVSGSNSPNIYHHHHRNSSTSVSRPTSNHALPPMPTQLPPSYLQQHGVYGSPSHLPLRGDDDAESVVSMHSAVHSYIRLHEHSAAQHPEYMMEYLARKLLILVNAARCPHGAKVILQDALVMRRVWEVVQHVLPNSRPVSGSGNNGVFNGTNSGVLRYALCLWEHLAPVMVTDDNTAAIATDVGIAASSMMDGSVPMTSPPPLSSSTKQSVSAMPIPTPINIQINANAIPRANTSRPTTPTGTGRVRISAINVNTFNSTPSTPMPPTPNTTSNDGARDTSDVKIGDGNNYLRDCILEIVQLLFGISLQMTDLVIIDQALYVLWLLVNSKSAQQHLVQSESVVCTAQVLLRIHCVYVQLPKMPDGQYPPESFLQAKALERILSIISLQIRLMDDVGFPQVPLSLLEGTGLMLLSAPRAAVWFPVILLAAEIIQVLVLHPSNVDKMQHVFKAIQATHGMAESTVDSQMITDLMISIQHTLHGALRPPIRIETQRTMDIASHFAVAQHSAQFVALSQMLQQQSQTPSSAGVAAMALHIGTATNTKEGRHSHKLKHHH